MSLQQQTHGVIYLPDFVKCKKVIFLEYPDYTIHLCIYGPLTSSVFKLPRFFNFFVSLSSLNILIAPQFFWPIKNMGCMPNLITKLITRRIQGTWTGYKKVLFLRGMGFKSFVNSNGFILLKLGMTNKPKFFFNNLWFLVFVKKFQRLLIKGLFYEETILFLQKLRLFRTPDIYCGKGFFFKGQRFKLKRGKRKR